MDDLCLDGWVYDTQSSHRYRARLRLKKNGEFWVSSEQVAEEAPEGPFQINECSISDRVGKTPRFISHSRFGRFETLENDLVDSAIDHYQKTGVLRTSVLSRVAHFFESNLKVVLATVLVTAGLMFSFVRFGIPLAAEWVAGSLSEDMAQTIGQGSLEILDASILTPSELTSSEKEKWQLRLKKNLSEQERKLAKVVFRKGDMLGANAFALPDGTIIFTDELLQLAKADEELQAILFHEIGHVRSRHALRQLLHQASVGALVLLITGDVNAASQAVIVLPTLMVEAYYSREMEIEADAYSRMRLAETGISLRYFSDILRRLEAQAEPVSDDESSRHFSGLLRTHPYVDERLLLLEAGSSNDK